MRRSSSTDERELDEHWDDFAARLSFVVSTAEDGTELAQAVNDAEQEIEAEGERLVYLSVPPGAMRGHGADAGEGGDRRELLAGRGEAVRARLRERPRAQRGAA